MAEVCKLEYHNEDERTYSVGIQELKGIQKAKGQFDSESGTYVDILHFVRDIFSLLDFSGIIRGKNE